MPARAATFLVGAIANRQIPAQVHAHLYFRVHSDFAPPAIVPQRRLPIAWRAPYFLSRMGPANKLRGLLMIVFFTPPLWPPVRMAIEMVCHAAFVGRAFH